MTIGIVFPSWRIPEHRLQDHFVWNERFYREDDVRVFAVTDKMYNLPDYAENVVLPEEAMPVVDGVLRFATTRARNAGIRRAIESGCSLVTCTEVDIAFERPAWAHGIRVAMSPGVAAVPWCRMSLSDDWSQRHAEWEKAPDATGTVTMTPEGWGDLPYSENQWGYGCDDGLLLKRLRARGVKIIRRGYIYHMAHVAGTPQKEFDLENPRTDHWNRENGLNPENFRFNRCMT